MNPTSDQVRKYWDAYVSQLKIDGTDWGTREFFTEIKSDHDKAYAGANRILELNSLKGMTLLELGCGIGLDTVEFAKHGADVTAIDLSPASVELSKRFLDHYSLSATVEVGDAEQLPYPSNRFDVVVARGILMYTPDERRVIDELYRVLKPGGQANITLHNRFSWYVWLAKISGRNLYDEAGDPPLNKLYSAREARRMLARFSRVHIHFDRYPVETRKRTGVLASVYNHVLVPATGLMPQALIRPFGFYMIVNAIK